jgi:rsbT co-antagonist protein RsbR
MNQPSLEILQQEIVRMHERIAELEHENALLKQSVAMHQQGEQRLQAILESMTDNVLVWDGNYDYLYANQAAIDHVGTTRDQVIGKNIRDGLGHIPEFMQLWMQRIDHVLATDEPLHSEDASMVGDAMVYSESVLAPIHGADGKPTAVALVYRDITDRKQQEEELRIFKAMADTAPDGFGIADHNGVITYANAAYQTMAGYGATLIGRQFIDHFSPEHQPEAIAAVTQARAGGIWRGLLHFQRPDGSHLPVETTGFAILDAQQQLKVMIGLFRDITERKQQEEALHQQAQILDQVRGSIVVVDMQGTITRWNRDSMRLFEYAEEEIIGESIVNLYPPEERERLMTDVIQPLQEQGELETEMLVQSKTGKRFPVLLSLSLLHNDSGSPIGMIGFSTDISEQKKMEAERAAMQQRVIDTQRDTLRELSTPLIPITDDMLIMPLIGTIDSQRAQQVMEALLEGVSAHQADLVILDITGVSVVDTQVAQAFIRAAQAVKLLGAQVMLTGIQPQIAQTLVHLGVDLSGIQTQASLQAGIAVAMAARQ